MMMSSPVITAITTITASSQVRPPRDAAYTAGALARCVPRNSEGGHYQISGDSGDAHMSEEGWEATA